MSEILAAASSTVKSTAFASEAERRLLLGLDWNDPNDWTLARKPAPPAPSDAASISAAWWLGFGRGSDGLPAAPTDFSAPDLTDAYRLGYESGRDNFITDELTAAAEALAAAELAELAVERLDHTAADEREWLGFELGADGVDAEPAGLLTVADRAAFARGHNAGDDYLWTVDPLFAAHMRDRAERSMADDFFLAAGQQF